MQAVYNANKFARLVRQRDRVQNWLDYYQLKYERHPNKKPTTKVLYPNPLADVNIHYLYHLMFLTKIMWDVHVQNLFIDLTWALCNFFVFSDRMFGALW